MPAMKNPLAAKRQAALQTAPRLVKVGRLVATPGVLELFAALERHMRKDWGEVCEEDWMENDRALKSGDRLLSSYKSKYDVKFWIITERGRSHTTILLPSEY